MATNRSKRSVEETPVSLQIAFYNVGWTDAQLSSRKHDSHRRRLGRDCAQAIEGKDLAMLCRCGFGRNRLDEDLGAHLGNSVGF